VVYILAAPWWMLMTGVLLVGTVVAVTLLWQCDVRWREILSLWLQKNDYRLESAEYRVFRLGPFTWTSARGHAVFYIAVIRPDSVRKRGWIRLSDPFGGPVDGNIEVHWET